MDNHELPYLVLVTPFLFGYGFGAVSAALVIGLLRVIRRG